MQPCKSPPFSQKLPEGTTTHWMWSFALFSQHPLQSTLFFPLQPNAKSLMSLNPQ